MVNQLYYGDNLEVLRRYIKDESVDLCYIDPPFNSKRNYNQIYNNIGAEDKAQAQAFIDTWEWDDHAIRGINEILINYHGLFTQQCIALITGLSNVLGKGSLLAYLVSMTLRITEIHRVLKPTGSFYLHCDPTASHYLKLILDAIFCAQGGDFLNEIIWHYRRWTGKANKFQQLHDTILFYSKSKKYTFNVIYTDYTEGSVARKKGGILHRFKKGEEPTLVSNKEIDEKGVRENDVWQIPFIAPSAKERLGYPTQKPEALLERIIKASSKENDIVLDAYCGCGTTVAVCQKLDRQWIGIDITYQSISLILKRLEDSFPGVLKTIKLHGIPKDIESAKALANKTDDRTRKEFEKWAILTYTNNKAVINAKKGADKGIDGIVYFQGDKNDPEKIIFQVKSGKVKSGDIRDLLGTMTLESASLAIFITLEEPTKDMLKTAKSAGFYQSKYMSHSCDKIQIVTIKEIIEDQQRLNIRLSYEVLKSAEKQKEVRVNQIELDI
ncbi:DNA methyltransferase [Aphanizomenon flos-aquae NRERC-008]|uniref:Methyltransferase n=1 Tax=Aphanizomenon flos-aquae FACHB-1249 TaxID=2692889 RepID=A0ABR8ISK5_APHFL|nr:MULTISPECIES: DNA methyltransferase [Aphanizomenon]MBD2392214.1 restriction endonuclease [Aphanizomenon flos-aquae FACHB-1171]MBD2558286.1 restriction endonuclease [Aphanizomenon flos-aquae FACHB-1290]MBD2632267.1 restriction endonuclease [Aphanizomenon sp. FACHB-1399]MBD2643247.1 restriction endonuclease [Aphanizomenon sp. FACHB-1401]MBD2658932.1 restriction endonuclease [Aphanizomenon flos-aquae FACHB-1265]